MYEDIEERDTEHHIHGLWAQTGAKIQHMGPYSTGSSVAPVRTLVLVLL